VGGVSAVAAGLFFFLLTSITTNTATSLLSPQVAECKFLNNKLVDVVNFMENMALKDSVEKDSFSIWL
jgi:hypothetical protein